mgnify:CR=1 FL=1
MAGQVNSWMGNIQIPVIPCIGDTVRKTSDLNYQQDGSYIADDGTLVESEPQTSSLWWLIAAGLAIGLVYRSGKKRRSHV